MFGRNRNMGEPILQHIEPPAPITPQLQEEIDEENAVREMFANNRHAPELQNPTYALIDVFRDPTAFNKRPLSEDEAKIPQVFTTAKRESDSGPGVVGDMSEFLQNFNNLTSNVFANISLADRGIFIAGGLVLSAATGQTEGHADSDVDLFLYGLTPDQANSTVRWLYSKLEPVGYRDVFRTSRAVTFVARYPKRHIQVITRCYVSPSEVLFGFDLDACSVGYDGRRVYCMKRFQRAIVKGFNLVNPSRRSGSYETRLSKYSKRGFVCLVPDLDKKNVRPEILECRDYELQGLARLLRLEAYQLQPRQDYRWDHPLYSDNINAGRLQSGRVGPHFLRNVGANSMTGWEALDETNYLHHISDYSAVPIPYGPRWYSFVVARYMQQADAAQLYSQSWSSGSGQHRHLFVTGIEGVLSGIQSDRFWCIHCRDGSRVDPDADERFVTGPIDWSEPLPVLQDVDGGRVRFLMSGRFQRPPEMDWEKDVYTDEYLQQRAERRARGGGGDALDDAIPAEMTENWKQLQRLRRLDEVALNSVRDARFSAPSSEILKNVSVFVEGITLPSDRSNVSHVVKKAGASTAFALGSSVNVMVTSRESFFKEASRIKSALAKGIPVVSCDWVVALASSCMTGDSSPPLYDKYLLPDALPSDVVEAQRAKEGGGGSSGTASGSRHRSNWPANYSRRHPVLCKRYPLQRLVWDTSDGAKERSEASASLGQPGVEPEVNSGFSSFRKKPSPKKKAVKAAKPSQAKGSLSLDNFGPPATIEGVSPSQVAQDVFNDETKAESVASRTCKVCNKVFASRNQMLAHQMQTGHSDHDAEDSERTPQEEERTLMVRVSRILRAANIKPDLFKDMVAAVAGISDFKLRSAIVKCITAAGGKYTYSVTSKVTHVFSPAHAVEARDLKVLAANRYFVPCVNITFLIDAIDSGEHPEITDYMMSLDDGSEGGSDAEDAAPEASPFALNIPAPSSTVNQAAFGASSSKTSQFSFGNQQFSFGAPAPSAAPQRGFGGFGASSSTSAAPRPVQRRAPAPPVSTDVPSQEGPSGTKGVPVPGFVNGRSPAIAYKAAHAPYFPGGYQILRQDVLQVTRMDSNNNKYYELELHKGSEDGQDYFRVFAHYGRTDDLTRNPNAGTRQCRYTRTLPEAEAQYKKFLMEKQSGRKGYKKVDLKSSSLGSDIARASAQNASRVAASAAKRTTSVKCPAEVRPFVQMIYEEAVSALTTQLAVNITPRGVETPLGVLNKEQVERGQEILDKLSTEITKPVDQRDDQLLKDLSGQFYTSIPHRLGRGRKDMRAAVLETPKAIEEKAELLQLMRDMLRINKFIDGSLLFTQDLDLKYEALGCAVTKLDPQSSEFTELEQTVMANRPQVYAQISMVNAYKLDRRVESFAGCQEIQNERLLFHGSKISNWVGILSRGLLLPTLAVDEMGVTKTEAAGWLGHGIYFADSIDTSTKYTSAGSTGTELMLLSKVKLGREFTTHQKMTTLGRAPPGHDSLHARRKQQDPRSVFTEDEYCVYNSNQQKMAYLIELRIRRFT